MLKIINHYFNKNILILFFLEFCVFLVSAYLGLILRFHNRVFDFNELRSFMAHALGFAVIMLFSLCAFGMYRRQLNGEIRETIARIGPAFLIGFTIISAIFFIIPSFQIGRGILSLTFIASGIGVFFSRFIFLTSHHSGVFASRVLVLGAGDLAKECGELAESLRNTAKCMVVGYLRDGTETISVPKSQIILPKPTLYETVIEYNVTNIYVALQEKRGSCFSTTELLDCKLRGVKIIDALDFFEREACQIRVNSLKPGWLVFGNGFEQSYYREFCKRTFDIIISIMIALISAPAMMLTAAMILLEDKGPIFYSQERVGLAGTTFKVHKFRSMKIDAEAVGVPQWATTKDIRVTRVGGLIRKLRIDELPQIFNVLVGEMSFVGPRPERPFFVEQLNVKIPFYSVRHSIKPGITGMAQVKYAYGASIEDALQKLQYDLYYVKNNCLFLDFLILLDTVQVVLLGKGAR